MSEEANGPEFLKPPELPGAQKAGAAPAPPSAAPRNLALGAAVCLLIAVGASGLFTRSRPPQAAEETPPADAAGLPAPKPPEYGGTGQTHLTQASRGAAEEDLKPPVPGLLMPRLSLETLSYTGPAAPTPEALARETEEDKAGCSTGDMFKCLRLGGRYLAGHGVERDVVRAFGLINKACAGGIAEACTLQGLMQLAGYGTPIDVPAGLALQEKTCKAGDMSGCTMLGNLYIEGKLLPLDVPRGLGYLRKACDAKAATACLALGALFNDGKVVPRDPGVAEYLFGQACDYSDRNACLMQQQLVQKRLAAANAR